EPRPLRGTAQRKDPFLVEPAGDGLAQVRPRGEESLNGIREEGLPALVEPGLGHRLELGFEKGVGCHAASLRSLPPQGREKCSGGGAPSPGWRGVRRERGTGG